MVLLRLFVLIAVLQGCASAPQEVLAPDTTLITASIQEARPLLSDPLLAEDAPSIVSALALGSSGKAWQNGTTGAHGEIVSAFAANETGRSCIAFTTTRESFDGVGLYDGKACEDAAGALRLVRLEMR
ncbi:RT0821/Lpp0805 family surface protein [Nitratireductor luteus]|uniref:RT0821/Lpp0805 family surface protein n=1 Tax=Nitratireductor luteus TaxID=2976980 RepID=UPI00224013AE|nr:RT0821/Lpp0805 family surface protein [Nitratireductor luteus]